MQDDLRYVLRTESGYLTDDMGLSDNIYDAKIFRKTTEAAESSAFIRLTSSLQSETIEVRLNLREIAQVD